MEEWIAQAPPFRWGPAHSRAARGARGWLCWPRSPGQHWETQGGTRRRQHWGCGASRVAAARNARQGDRRLPPKWGVQCARAGIGGGWWDRGWGQEKTSQGKWSRWGEKGAHRREHLDPDGKDRRWPRQGRSPGAGGRDLERLWRPDSQNSPNLGWSGRSGASDPPDHPSLPGP